MSAPREPAGGRVDDPRPMRPDLLPGRRRASRGGWGAAVVVGVILVVVLGGYVVAGALSEPAGAPVDVAGLVRIQPLSGWAESGTGTTAGVPFAQITRGSGNLRIAALAGRGGSAERLATDYARIVLSRELSQLSVSKELEHVTLRSGLPGVRFAYVGVVADTGTSVEGEVTTVVSAAGNGAVFDGWTPAGLLSFVRTDIDTMIDRAEVV
jgi:hypothetical protein